MPDTAWDEYCEASLDLSNQDDVGDPVTIDSAICSGQPVFTGTRVLRRLPLQLNLPYSLNPHGKSR